jgi:hypothetical protein
MSTPRTASYVSRSQRNSSTELSIGEYHDDPGADKVLEEGERYALAPMPGTK